MVLGFGMILELRKQRDHARTPSFDEVSQGLGRSRPDFGLQISVHIRIWCLRRSTAKANPTLSTGPRVVGLALQYADQRLCADREAAFC